MATMRSKARSWAFSTIPMPPDPTTPEGTVVQVVQAGYAIGDRVLRPAMVGVAKGGPKFAPQPNADNDSEPAEGIDKSV